MLSVVRSEKRILDAFFGQMPGKLWKPEEEQLLRQLWESGVHDLALLASKIDLSKGAIREKLKRVDLRVVVR